MTVKARDWRSRLPTLTVPVAGEELTYRKRGVPRLMDHIATIPVLGDAIEALAEANMKSKGNAEKLKAAITATAESNGISKGKLTRQLVTALPGILIDILVADTVLASEDERPAYRDWLMSLSLSEFFDALSGWVQLNLPEMHGPFVEGTAVLIAEVEAAWAGFLDRGQEEQPEAEPASDSKPSASETAEAEAA